MTQLMVEIEVSGEAFADSGEVARILHALADRIRVQAIDEQVVAHNASVAFHDGEGWMLRDVNGQHVGDAWLEGITP